MKKVLFPILFIAGMVVPVLVSAQQAGAGVVSATDSGAAIANAEEVRQKAVDFEAPSYFPSEWEAAEGLYTQAKLLQQKGTEAPRMVIAAYDSAAKAFESLVPKTIPLYAQARDDEIMAIRSYLIAAGIRDAEPEYFSLADKTALTALDLYEADDYYPARDSAIDAFKMYQILECTYNALLVREEIHEREFDPYDPDNYYQAGELLNTAMEAYEEGKISLSHENATESLRRYNLVLDAGWEAYAQKRSSLADGERLAAVDMKANIATKDLFAEADMAYGIGVQSFDSESFREAAGQFINSEALFITASSATTEKRRNAAETIREARQKIVQSGRNARQAGAIMEGGAK
jgi:hypothetical protein